MILVMKAMLLRRWHYLGMWDLYKLFYSLKVIFERSSETASYVAVDYQIDGDTDNLESGWVEIGSYWGDVIEKKVYLLIMMWLGGGFGSGFG
jgi:hypothetical protein